ncbi:MAG: type I methionyl aminopeptidase [Bdellovibrionales bacterium]|nr:type I methionyl aminopeptidase [Bdellovibrionales bacterium]
MVQLKSKSEVEQMRKAGAIVGQILHELKDLAKPGASTSDLDLYAFTRTKELGAKPAFKGYNGFPATLCVSLNEEVVHGIPSKKRILKDGDIVSCDFGVILNGWYGDSAKTYPVGKVAADTMKLVETTEKSLQLGIEECKPGHHLFDIGAAIQNYVEQFGYSVVREFVGHGIGRSLHEDPQVPNFGIKGKGIILKPGMVLAIEPMINAGKPEVKVLADGWTAITVDKAWSAHFEHTVAITETGNEILTKF